MSPERADTSNDEGVYTPKMSVPASPVAGTPVSEAQSGISILLAVAQNHSRQHLDDDLTSLNWLHESDILRGINFNPSPSNSVNSTPVKNGNGLLSDQSPPSDFVDDSSTSAADSSSGSVHSPGPHQSQPSQPSVGVQRNKHPHNVPYDPLVHTSNKPPFSFSSLIFMSIEDSVQKALPVKEIYAWIVDHFPYFKNAPTGWKNSVRHNLSLNKCFQKVEKAPNLGKGSLWTVDPKYRPNLIQQLTRSPFHPSSTLDPLAYCNSASSPAKPKVVPPPEKQSGMPNPVLFPYLSKKLAATAEVQSVKDESEATHEFMEDVQVAALMLSLKNGRRDRQRREKHVQVITTSPSQDHTYSAAEAGELVADEAVESEEERVLKSSICRKLDFEDEEERRIKEGAETLLNLAGIVTRKRYNSQSIEYSDSKTLRMSPLYDINKNEPDDKPIPFKPRLLRTKKKESKPKVLTNNNDEWVKHRRELERNQFR